MYCCWRGAASPAATLLMGGPRIDAPRTALAAGSRPCVVCICGLRLMGAPAGPAATTAQVYTVATATMAFAFTRIIGCLALIAHGLALVIWSSPRAGGVFLGGVRILLASRVRVHACACLEAPTRARACRSPRPSVAVCRAITLRMRSIPSLVPRAAPPPPRGSWRRGARVTHCALCGRGVLYKLCQACTIAAAVLAPIGGVNRHGFARQGCCSFCAFLCVRCLPHARGAQRTALPGV